MSKIYLVCYKTHYEALMKIVFNDNNGDINEQLERESLEYNMPVQEILRLKARVDLKDIINIPRKIFEIPIICKIGNRKPIQYYINENNCHICISHFINHKGYPTINDKGYLQTIPRYLYILKYGNVPDNIVIRHKCDNPLCINLEHLESGTARDNVNDKVIRGRQPYGENSSLSKLSEKQVKEILNSKLKQKELSKIYNVSQATISLIRTGKRWKYL